MVDFKEKKQLWEHPPHSHESKTRPNPTTCSVCQENEACFMCFDCSAIHCELCHDKLVKTKPHATHVYTFAEPKVIKDVLTCKDHGKFIASFCVTCVRGVCQMCLVKGHEQHDIRAFCKETKIKVDPVENAPDVLSDLDTQLNKVQPLLNVHEAHVLAMKGVIREEKLKLLASIEREELELIARIDEEHANFQAQLAEKKHEIEDAKSKLTRLTEERALLASPLRSVAGVSLAKTERMDIQNEDRMNDLCIVRFVLPEPSKYRFLSGHQKISLGILSAENSPQPTPTRKTAPVDLCNGDLTHSGGFEAVP